VDLTQIGKALVVFAAVIGFIGVLLMVGPRVPGLSALGHLPGDLSFGGDNVRVYIRSEPAS
jgi:hypothetical protein